MVGSGRNGHVPFSLCIDVRWALLWLPKKQYRDARFVILFRKVKSATRANMRGSKYCYVGTGIVLFVLGAAVGVTMGGGFVL